MFAYMFSHEAHLEAGIPMLPLPGFNRVIVWIAIWHRLVREGIRAIPRPRQRRFLVDSATGLEPR
jgi:hypothetical protein